MWGFSLWNWFPQTNIQFQVICYKANNTLNMTCLLIWLLDLKKKPRYKRDITWNIWFQITIKGIKNLKSYLITMCWPIERPNICDCWRENLNLRVSWVSFEILTIENVLYLSGSMVTGGWFREKTRTKGYKMHCD